MTETAPFVFWNEACEKGTHDSAIGDTGYNVVGEDTETGMITTSQAVSQRKAVIDGGATRTIAFIAALEQ